MKFQKWIWQGWNSERPFVVLVQCVGERVRCLSRVGRKRGQAAVYHHFRALQVIRGHLEHSFDLETFDFLVVSVDIVRDAVVIDQNQHQLGVALCRQSILMNTGAVWTCNCLLESTEVAYKLSFFFNRFLIIWITIINYYYKNSFKLDSQKIDDDWSNFDDSRLWRHCQPWDDWRDWRPNSPDSAQLFRFRFEGDFESNC